MTPLLLTYQGALEEYPDSELMRRIALQDEKALDMLYARYSILLYSLLVRILGVVEEAEDLLQEIFVQVWHKAHLYQEQKGNVHVWLISLARNRAIDRLRSRDRRHQQQRVRSEEIELFLDFNVESNPFQSLLRSENTAVVHRALSSLPKNQRQVIELAYYEGFTQSEIAKRLGKPLGTVKTQMRQGMIKLRNSLEKTLR